MCHHRDYKESKVTNGGEEVMACYPKIHLKALWKNINIR
jgi:hypothetical protein